MNSLPTWAQLVIAIFGSGTIGGIAGALSSTFAARQKIKELEVTYRQRLEENYRTNASSHIDTLYIPLNIILNKLDKQLKVLLDRIDYEKEAAIDEFRKACGEYIDEIWDLISQGKDVYLTGELEKRLRSFTEFIRISLLIEEPIYAYDKLSPDHKALVPLLPLMTIFASSKTKKDIEYELKYAEAAPISTVAFLKRFVIDMSYLKSLIREVTLGTVQKP
jgi:hypothetical protein